MAPKAKPGGRRPALGGALGPTREDAQSSQEVIFEYSQKLNAQVVALESENLELKDSWRASEAQTKSLAERVLQLEKENAELRDTGFATFQERNFTVHQANESLRAKQGEVMLLRHNTDRHRQREEELATNNARLAGIAERLQGERSQLQRQVVGLEATACAMQAEIAQQANSEAHAALQNKDLDRQVNSLTMQKLRLDEEMGVRHVEIAHLRHTREELMAERQVAHQLREELVVAADSQSRLQDEAVKLGQTVSALHIEVAHIHSAKQTVDAEMARSHDAIGREGALADGLRARITELEDVIGSLRRGNMALEGENGALRAALGRARAEVEGCLEASTKLVHEKGGVEQMADEQSTRRIELERLLEAANNECKRLRRNNDLLQADNQEMQGRLQQLEADNVVLHGQLKGTEVVLRGMRGDYADLQLRKQHGYSIVPLPGIEGSPVQARAPSPPRAAPHPQPQYQVPFLPWRGPSRP